MVETFSVLLSEEGINYSIAFAIFCEMFCFLPKTYELNSGHRFFVYTSQESSKKGKICFYFTNSCLLSSTNVGAVRIVRTTRCVSVKTYI